MKTALAVLAAIVLAVPLYLGATIVGALVPASPEKPSVDPAGGARIYLLTTLLHADFAIPVDEAVRDRFAFLGEAGVPVGNPALRYLVFGWGSRAFYTATPTLADISASATLRAITGDVSVMHVMPASDVSGLENAMAVNLPAGGLERLLDYIETSFVRNGASRPGYGFGDIFYEARGGFNIFHPCNIWVAAGLRQAGLSTGAWTPTTHALMLGLSLHAPKALED